MRVRKRLTPLRKREITALVMPPEGASKGPCNTSNPSYITACFGDTAALTLSCVPPGQDKGVVPPGRRLPSSLPTQQGKWPFLRGLLTPREARIGETQIPFGDSRSHCARSSAACSWSPPAKYSPARSSSSVAGRVNSNNTTQGSGGNPRPQRAALTSGRGERLPAQARRLLLLPRSFLSVEPHSKVPLRVGLNR